MPRGPFAPFLHYVRSRRRAADGDAELLARFAADRDEDAFVELVRRHGPLVWGVARQVLGQDQDAEDAFQATFLLLARNAGSVRTAAAVAGWLHGAAWRVATKARSRATVRRQHERFVPPRSNSDAAADVALRELQALLHEEVAALPEKYRTPFVLCVLEGRGRVEVARSLGWNEGTLSTRLAWARRRLRSRLLRRGVDVAAALAAVEITRGAVPAALAASAMTAARTGVVPVAVAALASGGFMTTKVAPLAALGLVLGAIAIGTTGIMGSDQPAQPAAKDKPAPQPAVERPGRPTGTCALTVTGTATGPDGNPVAGANVFLRLTTRSEKPFATVKTDAHGHYEFKDLALPMAASIRVTSRPNPDPVLTMVFQISAIADALAAEWTDEFGLPAKSEAVGNAGEVRHNAGAVTANLKFTPAAHFQGRLIDDNGNPVVGAKVRMTLCDHLSVPPAPLNPGLLHGALGADCLPETFTTATTDSDGRFRIDGVPADAIGLFTISHPDFAATSVTAALIEPRPAARGSRTSTLILRSAGGLTGKIIVGNINVTLKSPRAVGVTVVSGTTGKPIADARVSIGPINLARNRVAALQPPSGPPPSHASGTTDAEGKIALRLPPGTYTLTTIASNRSPSNPPAENATHYCRQVTSVDVNDDPTQSLTVRLEPACKINFEVVEAGTGKPIVNQHLRVEMEHGFISGRMRPVAAPPALPVAPPPQGKPVVDWRGVDGTPAETKTTDADGETMTWANPGKGRIRAISRRPVQYEEFETTDPVTLEAGGEVKLRVELRKIAQPAAPQPLPPPPAPPLAAANPATYPLTVSGATTGPDRKPVQDATIYLMTVDGTDAKVVAKTKTDAKGSYEFRNIHVPLPREPATKEKPVIFPIQIFGSAPGFAAEWRRRHLAWPGAVGGQLVTPQGYRVQPVSEPLEVNFPFRKPEVFTGRIVDDRGRPVAGAKVGFRVDGDFMLGDLPEEAVGTRADADGRFRLVGNSSGSDELTVRHPDFADIQVGVMTPKAMETERVKAASNPLTRMTMLKNGRMVDWLDLVWVGEINLTLVRPREVPVRVVANKSGEPLKDVEVGYMMNGKMLITCKAKTDAAGRAVLRLPPGEYEVSARGPVGSKFVEADESATVGAVPNEQPHTVRLIQGCTVEIEAVDVDTGFPVRHLQFEQVRDTNAPGTWGSVSDFALGYDNSNKETDKLGKITAILRPGKCLIRPGKPYVVAGENKPVELPEGGTVKLRFKVR
jgi:RNA polymerase sigma factor (sigma-70 family)